MKFFDFKPLKKIERGGHQLETWCTHPAWMGLPRDEKKIEVRRSASQRENVKSAETERVWEKSRNCFHFFPLRGLLLGGLEPPRPPIFRPGMRLGCPLTQVVSSGPSGVREQGHSLAPPLESKSRENCGNCRFFPSSRSIFRGPIAPPASIF